MYDAIIIGAGMSGLAAGVRLALFGKQVCILERHSTIGGLNSFYRLGGRDFDVGLHALTNYASKGSRGGPLARLLRQLRLGADELCLAPQLGSAVVFPDVQLEFSNDFELLRSEIRRHFPSQLAPFDRLVAGLANYHELGQEHTRRSARQTVQQWIDEPLLVEMLFCPVLFYGGPRAGDLDFGQFSVLFRSIFLEGLARPLAGVRQILDRLAQKFRAHGGELRLRSGVARLRTRNGRVEAVVLDDGSELAARKILSSAGLRETMRLCGVAESDLPPAGSIAFVESIFFLDTPPSQLGLDRTVIFFNDSAQFRYGPPDDLVDLHSGVVCVPNHFAYDEPMTDGCVRLTALAHYGGWARLEPAEYRQAKPAWQARLIDSASRFVPDFRHSVVTSDFFTPVTVRRFTGHDGGAVYGCPVKHYDGRTHFENLFLCGTDQGLVGIVGALLSGVLIANQYVLHEPLRAE